MSGPAQAGAAAAVATVAVTSYKEILQAVLEKRPSGTRQRLATALGKNRSFVSQITNPAYGVPVPHRHLETIFDICRFSPEERRHFLAAYQLAHPHRLKLLGGGPRLRAHTVMLPDLGDADRNRALDAVLSEFLQGLAKVLAKA